MLRGIDQHRLKTHALIGINPKSTHGPCDEARHIRATLHAAASTGMSQIIPVYFGKRRLGWVAGERNRQRAYWFGNITGMDDIIDANYNGRGQVYDYHKQVTPFPLLQWIDLWAVTGNPDRGTYTGTAFTARALTNVDPGCIPFASVSPYQRYHTLISSGCPGGSSASFGTVLLYDRLLTYEACTYNANSPHAMTNVAVMPRYNSAARGGAYCMVTVQTTIGATATVLSAVVYTNESGAGSHNVPTSPAMNMLVSKTADTGFTGQVIVAPVYQLATFTSAPFLPLQDGDVGMSSIQSFTTSAANTGTICFALIKPIAYMPLDLGSAIQGFQTHDTVQQVQNLEPLYDGCCLSFAAVMSVASSNAGVFGAVGSVWN